MRVWTESYGCTLNQGETFMLRQLALQAGYLEAQTPEEADTIILGSCVVIDHTERRMWKRLRELSQKNIVIGGCLPPVQEERLRKEFPNILIVPPGRMEVAAEFFGTPDLCLEPTVQGGIAVLPIATGCEGNCAYCLTRMARGGLQSRPISQVVGWAEHAIENGSFELRLSAQDSGVYGRDNGTTLPELLEEITALEGDFMVRIGMMNPDHLPDILDDLVDFYNGPKAYKFLHLPVQSGSDKVLKAMRRGYTSQEAEVLAKEMRERVPGLTISTDIIVGFPGETEEDFLQSLELMERMQPDSINITRFSKRPGTDAETMPDQVHGRPVKGRSRKITELRFKISEERKKARIGEIVEALVLQSGEARTLNYTPLVLKGKVAPGPIKARITGCSSLHLEGEVV